MAEEGVIVEQDGRVLFMSTDDRLTEPELPYSTWRMEVQTSLLGPILSPLP